MTKITTTARMLSRAVASSSSTAAAVTSRRALTTAAATLLRSQRSLLPSTSSILLNATATSATTNCCMSSTLRAAPTWQTKPPSPNPSGGEILSNMTKENPYKDAVRFEWKNQKYTFHDLNFNSVALATGFLETGLQPGDVCLSWLPLHFAEHVMLQFACSKAGLILYWLDPAMAKTDPDQARLALHNALTVSKANVLMIQDAGDDVNYLRLAERVIPETRFYDYAEGFPFVTPRFPHLRLTIQTGWTSEEKEGFLLLRDMLVPAEGLLDSLTYSLTINEDSPLMGRFVLDNKGIPTGVDKPLTNKEVLEKREWSTYSSVLHKEYLEIHGKGVVF